MITTSVVSRSNPVDNRVTAAVIAARAPGSITRLGALATARWINIRANNITATPASASITTARRRRCAITMVATSNTTVKPTISQLARLTLAITCWAEFKVCPASASA